MHINQYQQLCRNFSAYKKKIFLLKAYTKPVCFDINIDDPYGKSIQQYFLCFEEISRSVEIVAGKLSL
jgi:protein-tyrosine-phosphatase